MSKPGIWWRSKRLQPRNRLRMPVSKTETAAFPYHPAHYNIAAPTDMPLSEYTYILSYCNIVITHTITTGNTTNTK